MMARTSESYLTGKVGESKTWAYLSAAGFVRPTATQRVKIATAFGYYKLTIHKSGFDVVSAEHAAILDSIPELVARIDRLKLYEVKTCGAERKAKVSDGFKGLGFTLTRKERDNADVLGSRYRFLFVNLRMGTHRECLLTDFFIEGRARIYETWSVFLTQDLPPTTQT